MPEPELISRPLKRFAILPLFLLFAILAASCNIPALALNHESPAISSKVSLMASNLNTTPTATPFLPLDPTPTYIPTAVPTLAPSPTPEAETDAAGNTEPAELLDQPEKVFNLLVMGSDQRIGEGGFRTDTIILVTINIPAKKVTMISFPRDLYVYIPGWSYQRINTAMFYGGFDSIAQTLKYNFGVQPDHYILVSFDAFEQIINTLGGIDVEVGRDFTDQYWDKSYKTIPAGTVHMDSAIALWYARTRSSSNDFDRARRQQEVLFAIGRRIVSADVIDNVKDLYDILIDNVTTNLTWSEIAPLIPLTVKLRDKTQVESYVIGPGQVYDWITPGGAMVLIPRQDQISLLLQEALGEQ
jgi:LCP family protein required for cell wall assembly